MKIAFLNIYNGVIERGSEVFVKEIAGNLSQNNKVWVFQTGKEEKEKYYIKHISGIPYKPQGFIYDLLVLFFTIKCLVYLWKEKFDWIIPINGRWQAILCRILRAIRGGKILISGHAGIGFDDKFNIVFGNPDIFVALTPKAFSWAKQFTSKVKNIPNGVNLTLFNPEIKAAEIDLKRPIILCNSALLPYKRIELAIKAVAQLPEVSLLVIGEGPLKREIQHLGQKLLGDRFQLTPTVDYKNIASYYTASKVFTLPSYESEAFGLVYLEAMSCNIPVVAPDDENRRIIIGEAGCYTDPTKISQYAGTLNQALKKDFGNKPRIQAEKFSWVRIASLYNELMNSLIK